MSYTSIRSVNGLSGDIKKDNMQLAKLLAMNALTAKEVDKIHSVWEKWDNDFATLTAGTGKKKKMKSSDAIKIIGPRPTIESIVGHPLTTPTGTPVPDPSKDQSTESGDSFPWLPVLGGLGLVGIAIFAAKSMKKEAA